MANGFVHSAGGIAEGAYNTGLWTAAFLFIPLSLWVIYECAIRGPYSGKVVGAAFAAGAVTHAVLFVGYGRSALKMSTRKQSGEVPERWNCGANDARPEEY